MLGDGIVSFGRLSVTVCCRKAKSSPKIVSETPSLPPIRIAAGVNSISPCSLRNWTVISPGAFEIPPSR